MIPELWYCIQHYVLLSIELIEDIEKRHVIPFRRHVVHVEFYPGLLIVIKDLKESIPDSRPGPGRDGTTDSKGLGEVRDWILSQGSKVSYNILVPSRDEVTIEGMRRIAFESNVCI